MVRLESSCMLVCLLIIAASCEQNITTSIPSSTAEVTTTEIPPFEFPRNDSKHKVVQNDTLRIKFSNETASPRDTEVPDLNLKSLANVTFDNDSLAQKVFGDVKNSLSFGAGAKPKDDAELIQTGNNEDARLLKGKSEEVATGYMEDYGQPALVQGQVAAILAGVFVVAALAAYIGLLSWRRFLENRYGNREMLVNEEEFNEPSDMRHFSL